VELTIKFFGEDEVRMQLDPKAAVARIEKAMDVVINDAASLLSEASPVGVYGHLQGAWLQTVGTEVSTTGVVGFSDPTPTAPYAWFVVHGRAPGRMPPPIALLRWVVKKLGVSGMAARSVAWLVARKIGRRGTKGNDFVSPVVAKNKKTWGDVLTRAAMPPEK
jgi:hypothetical protein